MAEKKERSPLGEKLRAYLNDNRVHIYDFCRRVPIAPSTFYAWEWGEKKITGFKAYSVECATGGAIMMEDITDHLRREDWPRVRPGSIDLGH